MIGIVVIGRNEGERLRRCLASVAGTGAPIVYVDSGSTDGSVEAARAVGAQVVELDMSRPFTAARARNEGWRRLAETAAPDIVQFVDGDCEVAEGWLDTAAAALAADPGLAAVAGRRRETNPGASLYNRYCDMEWDTPIGEAASVGGDAAYRHAALAEVGGFDDSFICGEEPELCFRLRARGWRLARLDAEMTRHDAAMTRFSQYWTRSVRSGWASAEAAATYEAGAPGRNARSAQRARLWGVAVPGALALCLLATAAALLLGSRFWPLPALAAAALVGLVGLLVLKTAAGRRATGDSLRDALLYGVLTTLAKPAEATGERRYTRTRARGEAATLIEYKGGPAPRAEQA